jgi:hypothetical protein
VPRRAGKGRERWGVHVPVRARGRRRTQRRSGRVGCPHGGQTATRGARIVMRPQAHDARDVLPQFAARRTRGVFDAFCLWDGIISVVFFQSDAPVKRQLSPHPFCVRSVLMLEYTAAHEPSSPQQGYKIRRLQKI